MKLITRIMIISIISFIVITTSGFTLNKNEYKEKDSSRIIKIALYDCGYNNRYFLRIFNYSWNINSFNPTLVRF